MFMHTSPANNDPGCFVLAAGETGKKKQPVFKH